MSNNIILFYKKNRDMFDQMLINNLVNPKVLLDQNDDGETVLHHLINSHDNKCVQNVLNFVNNNFSVTEKQKFIDTQDKSGDTAFHLAIRNKDFETATLLDIFGANKKIPNNQNEIIADTDSSEFIDSEQEIKCGNSKKMDKLIGNIIKPTKTYDSDINLESDSNSDPESLDDIVLTDYKSSKSTKLTKSPKSPKSPKSGNFISNFLSNVFGYKSNDNQTGGAGIRSENISETQSTSEFLKYISEKIGSNNQNGGYDIRSVSESSVSSFDEMTASSSETESFDSISVSSKSSTRYLGQFGGKKSKKSKKSKKFKISREVSKSEEIHTEVIKMIQDLGYALDEAKTIKAALYSYTKQQHPELSNYERALKMRSYTTQQHIANLDIESVKQALATHYATKTTKEAK